MVVAIDDEDDWAATVPEAPLCKIEDGVDDVLFRLRGNNLVIGRRRGRVGDVGVAGEVGVEGVAETCIVIYESWKIAKDKQDKRSSETLESKAYRSNTN